MKLAKLVVAALAALGMVVTSCGGDDDAATTDATTADEAQETAAPEEATTPEETTRKAGPPCYGLEQTDRLPDWVGEGVAPSSPSDPDRDGCVVDQGVIVVATDLDPNVGRRFMIAAVEDCAAFGATMVDLPADLQIPPDAIQSWVCFQPAPSEEGTTGINFIAMEGSEPAQG